MPPSRGIDKQGGGEDLPVSRRDQQIGLQSSNQFQAFGRIDVLGLQNSDSVRLGRLLDQARDDLLLAALRPVGLSHQRDHVDARFRPGARTSAERSRPFPA